MILMIMLAVAALAVIFLDDLLPRSIYWGINLLILILVAIAPFII